MTGGRGEAIFEPWRPAISWAPDQVRRGTLGGMAA